jgi:hypothetical protein
VISVAGSAVWLTAGRDAAPMKLKKITVKIASVGRKPKPMVLPTDLGRLGGILCKF